MNSRPSKLLSSIAVALFGLSAIGVVSASEEAAAPAATAGGKPAQVGVCAACHGENGVSASPLFPNLAGQHRSYIEVALKGYKSGARKNAVMGGQAAGLSDADIKALAVWYSSQKPVLYTVSPEGEAKK